MRTGEEPVGNAIFQVPRRASAPSEGLAFYLVLDALVYIERQHRTDYRWSILP